MATQNVKFYFGTQAKYDALVERNSLALYFIEDTQRLYKGDVLIASGATATSMASGLMSAEDKVKLDDLVAGGGLRNLTPVDGTIIISDKTDGGKSIGVAVSTQDGNTLVIAEDGLFVPAPEKVNIPEYTIEKQTTAEDGYSATYKLKRTLDGVSTYVGDSINVLKDLVINKGSLETVVADGVPYDSAVVGDPYIDLVLNDAEASHIYIPVKGLIDTYIAGDGIEIVDNKISIKVAADSHGLVAVDGSMAMLLATANQDGAMSKEDKAFIDAIPHAYIAHKYEISDTPEGTLVDYRDHEIRVMCPDNSEFTKQAVGVGGDANTYYMTLKTYAPNDSIVGYIEHLGDQTDSEILTNFSIDKYGRRYQSTWLGLAKLNEETGVWSYYGANSTANKFIGWDYQIDWYDANNRIVASDCVRINLSNESCHNNLRPYYGPNYDISTEIASIKDAVAEMEESYTWGEM